MNSIEENHIENMNIIIKPGKHFKINENHKRKSYEQNENHNHICKSYEKN